MSIEKSCPVCGSNFSVPECRELTAKTCSQKCRGVLIAAAYKAKRVECNCKLCGKAFSSPKSQAEHRVYCSYQCAANAQRGKLIGSLAPDGLTTIHSDGYILERLASHPFAVSGYVLQHRLVMEDWMREVTPNHPFLVDVSGKKYLRRDIGVHHGNEVKDDNRRRNLVACTSSAHRDIHDGRPVMQGTMWPESGDEIESVPRRVVTTCKECGNHIEPKLCDVLRGGGKFCSKVCAAKWNGRAKESKVDRQCVQCGTGFKAWPASIKQGRGKFCSNACRYKARIGRNPKDVIPY